MAEYIDSNFFDTIPTTKYKITTTKPDGKQQEIFYESCKFIINAPIGSDKFT